MWNTDIAVLSHWSRGPEAGPRVLVAKHNVPLVAYEAAARSEDARSSAVLDTCKTFHLVAIPSATSSSNSGTVVGVI